MASQGMEPDDRQTAEEAAALGRNLAPEQAAYLGGYLRLLMKWNRKMNLVGPADWREVLRTLVADSWRLADLLARPEVAALFPAKDERLAIFDFGAGAGLPGIPLRVFWGRGRYVLIEARAKRAAFLRQALAELRPPGVSVFEGRCEAFLAKPRDPAVFHLCLSRAFMPWPEFLAMAATAFDGRAGVLTMTSEDPDLGRVPRELARTARLAYEADGKARFLTLFMPAETQAGA